MKEVVDIDAHYAMREAADAFSRGDYETGIRWRRIAFELRGVRTIPPGETVSSSAGTKVAKKRGHV